MYGFSYCGIHCSQFGIEYIPNEASRMFDWPEYKINDETVTNRHGSYYCNNTVAKREFSQDCFIEKQTEETIDKIYQWLHRDTKGRLIFDKRPYVYYDVRPSKVVKGKMYPTTNGCGGTAGLLWSGTFTIHLTAYEQPFGKMAYTSYEGSDTDGAQLGTGIMQKKYMPSPLSPSASDCLVYNPGTEVCDTLIRIAGTAPNGQKIFNRTTGDKCHLQALPADPDYLEISSEDGSVRLSSSDFGLAFEFHDEGYIRLAPCTPYYRNIDIEYESGSNVVKVSGVVLEGSFVGKYMRVDGAWRRIVSIQDANHVVIDNRMNTQGFATTMIVVMNEIEIEGAGANITKLELEYIPLVR